MAYTAWSVVFGEQPTAAKWNQLGANDAGFKDGTNFDDSIIDSRHYVDNSIDAEHLATNTLLLGRVRRTSNFTSTSTSEVLVTGMELTVTIPSGGRSLMVLFSATNMYYSAGSGGAYDNCAIWDGAVGSGTKLARNQFNESSGGGQAPVCIIAIVDAPAAGSKTFRVSASTNNAAAGVGLEANASYPMTLAAILV